jgi:chromosome segregation ATPase
MDSAHPSEVHRLRVSSPNNDGDDRPAVTRHEDALAAAQIEAHAAELHEQLLDRLRELDRREASLNARAAEAENEVRQVQLLISEREAAVRKLEQKLLARTLDLDSRETRLKADEATCRATQLQNQQDAERRDQAFEQLRQESARLDLLRRTWQDEAAAEVAQLDAQRADWQQRQAVCQHRERLLDGAVELLERQLAEARRHAQQLREQQRQLDLRTGRQHQQWVELQRQWHEQTEERQQELDLQAETLQKRQIALAALERDIEQSHRQALEMRLVTEQLRIHLLDDASEEELTKATARWRERLAEVQRPAEAKLAAKRDEVKRLMVRLKERRQDLEARREQLRVWFQQQQAEIEQQARMLTSREEQLQQTRWELWQQREAWNQQRLDLDQQIRELTLQLQRTTRQPTPSRFREANRLS